MTRLRKMPDDIIMEYAESSDDVLYILQECVNNMDDSDLETVALNLDIDEEDGPSDLGDLIMWYAEEGSDDVLYVLQECVNYMSDSALESVVTSLRLDHKNESMKLRKLESRIRRLERALRH